jgi:predicted dehydrogenase
MARRKVKFGVIGLGLMGREFGSAAARWCHLLTDSPVPEIAGVCDTNETARDWFTGNFSSVKIATSEYRELLDSKEIEAVYCAVPHNLHEQLYTDILKAGKHLMGEKPFGIDQKANTAILEELDKHPELVVRCSSQFPFFPACQRLISWIREGRFGRIIEVRGGFAHSSDMDLSKPINWKRMIEYNGEYGCLGDLGIHTQHVPFRMGWIPKSVYGVLSNIVPERPDGKGGQAPCLTWDNAALVCTVGHSEGYTFPMTLETKRLDPGSTNRWFLEVYGLEGSAKFTTDDPNAFTYLETGGKEQAWSRVNVGHKTMIPSITGGIFEFGFSDGILQMWAAYLRELAGMEVSFGCFTPEESRLSHALHTAALASHKNQSVEPVAV